MRYPIRLAATVAVLVLSACFAASPLHAGAAEGELVSASFRIPAFTLNSGGDNHVSTSFKGTTCLGELGVGQYESPSFKLLPGYCAQQNWFFKPMAPVDTPLSEIAIRTTFGLPGPNPTLGPVRLSFSLAKGETGTLEVFDVTGRRVRMLADRENGPLVRVMDWDLTNDRGRIVSSGIYFARLRTPNQLLSHGIVVLGH